MKHFFLLCIFLGTSGFLCQTKAQAPGVNETKYVIHARRTTEPIVLDGHLKEKAWAMADTAGNFRQFFPYDTALADSRTFVRVLFDKQFLYIAAECYQPRHYVVSSLKRDFGRGQSDIFGVNIDTFRDKLNGINFAVSPYGVQREGLITNGQVFTTDWDNKWFVKVSNADDRFVVEMAIPFKTLRYKLHPGENTWLINFMRNDITRNESSSWAPIPRNFGGQALAFSGTLVWDETPPRPGANVSLIPYVLTETSRDFQNEQPAKRNANAGFDAKIAVTPSLNLDLTVNPDFAQVEVDQQVTNLSRFELFFPERRQFFLENSDLFGSFGLAAITPFFSRRIGLFRNTNTGFNERVPILAGARLSGRINKNWRIGFLSMQTASQSYGDSVKLPTVNYGMLALQRRVSSRSFISAFLVNRQTGPQAADSKVELSNNRVAGLEYQFASVNNQWQGKAFYHQMLNSEGTALPERFTRGFDVRVDNPAFNGRITTYEVGENFRAEMGYVPRRGILRSSGEANYVYFPKGRLGKVVNRFQFGPDWDMVYGKPQGRIIDWDAGLFGEVTLQNQSQISFALMRLDYTYLFSAFDPTNTGGVPLPEQTSYLYFSNRLGFVSNVRKPFSYSFSSRYGQYFNGRIAQLQTTLSYRYQPFGIFSLNFNYNGIRLPKPYSNSDLFLVGPKADLSFTKSLFLTALAQYNNQINNINTNIRLQWRYKPVSDLFVVYTDNYFAYEAMDEKNRFMRAWQPKNRALVVKLTYWLNV